MPTSPNTLYANAAGSRSISSSKTAAAPGRTAATTPREQNYAYYQADKPITEQTEALGHAVRAAYFYAGAADVARLTGDSDLLASCERLWRNIVDRKLYIIGGIGATHGEAFSFDYDLPNDTAYSESCAAIALAFFARRMLEIQPKSEYADVMESALYNTTLAGMALDGKSFFYVNPLEVVPEACHRDERKAHVKPVRQKWFGCACCPPNIARIVEDVQQYAYTIGDDSSTLYVHLYMGGGVHARLSGVDVRLDVMSDMPWSGKGSVAVGFDAGDSASDASKDAVSRSPSVCPLGPVAKPLRCGHRARPRRHLPRHQRRIPVSDRRMA